MQALFSAFLQILTLTVSDNKTPSEQSFSSCSAIYCWCLAAVRDHRSDRADRFYCTLLQRCPEMPAHHFSHQLVPGFHVNGKRPTAPLRQSQSDFLPRWPISAREGAGRLDKNRAGARDRVTAGWLPLFSRKNLQISEERVTFCSNNRTDVRKKVVAEAFRL